MHGFRHVHSPFYLR